MFSRRVPARLEPNALARALSQRQHDRRPFLDLTASNPTRAGLDYPPDLLAPLAQRRGFHYAPIPFGLTEARAAVAEDFRRRRLAVGVGDLALTASTSEAYSLLFKLLCDPEDEVLIPQPSYPLFEHLTRLDAVIPVPYALEYHGRWTIDPEAVERSCSARTRAILIVNPNNPTGSYVSQAEVDALARVCAHRGIAMISDDVFADYELTDGAAAQAGHLLGRTDVVGFTLGGLSKSIGLPQAKLAWIALSGPSDRLRDARERLELIADTYLSVSTPVQVAAASLLEAGQVVRAQIQRRITANLGSVRRQAAMTPSCRLLNGEGGWYAVLQVPSILTEEELVLDLLDQDDVLVHPGYFFDFPTESFLIVSLLTIEADFADGIARVLRRFPEGTMS